MKKIKVDKNKHKFNFNLKKIKKVVPNVKIIEKISEFLEIPEEMVKSRTKLTMIDNKIIYMEGSNKIDDFDKTYIKIKTNKCIIIVHGKDLDIKEAKALELCIEGEIHSVEYLKEGESI